MGGQSWARACPVAHVRDAVRLACWCWLGVGVQMVARSASARPRAHIPRVLRSRRGVAAPLARSAARRWLGHHGGPRRLRRPHHTAPPVAARPAGLGVGGAGTSAGELGGGLGQVWEAERVVRVIGAEAPVPSRACLAGADPGRRGAA